MYKEQNSTIIKTIAKDIFGLKKAFCSPNCKNCESGCPVYLKIMEKENQIESLLFL